jgi:hypothetical protein
MSSRPLETKGVLAGAELLVSAHLQAPAGINTYECKGKDNTHTKLCDNGLLCKKSWACKAAKSLERTRACCSTAKRRTYETDSATTTKQPNGQLVVPISTFSITRYSQ